MCDCSFFPLCPKSWNNGKKARCPLELMGDWSHTPHLYMGTLTLPHFQHTEDTKPVSDQGGEEPAYSPKKFYD